MCTLPAATLRKEATEGELWFVGGEHAFGTIDWEPVDVGETLARKAIQEWLGLGSEDTSVWQTSSEGFAWARGSAADRLEERCAAAAIVDSGEKATKLARVGMEVVWGLKRVYKREIWNKCSHKEEEEEGGDPEAPAVMVVRGKDATRGSYQMPANTWVRKKGLTVGRKLREGQKWRALKVCNLDELVYGDGLGRKKPSRKSKWIPKKAGQWLRLIDLAASRKRKGPPAPGEEGDECQLCGREAAATQEGVRLCRRCNNSAPGAALGRELEGYMLASWCLALLGGEAWMRTVMLDKGRWRRWRRALRNEERSEGAEQWWWKLLAAIIPEEEREGIQTVSGNALTAGEWKAWWVQELQGTQGLSLLQEFYEEQPSGCRTAWHRQQLRVIYGMWGVQTPLEATLMGRGEDALGGWAAQGRVGSSKWPKHRGEVVSEERWAEMLRDLRDRQRETTARAKELQQQRKRQRVERAAVEAETKRREQAERAAARQRASENKKKQPVLHRVDREGHGGVFDKQWEKGEGFWVRTARPPGRGMEWLGGKAASTSVHEAKRWPEGRSNTRKAVLGRWLEWVADVASYRQGEGGEVRAEEDSADQAEVGDERQEGDAAERRGGQENGAQELRNHRAVGMARSGSDVAPAQSGVREGNRRHGPSTRAGMASEVAATNGLRMEGPNVRMHSDKSRGLAQCLGSGARSEHEEREDEGPAARAATRIREIARQRGQGRTDGLGEVTGGKGTKGRHTRPEQLQGAVSAPPHPTQPHQAQPHGERRPTRSRTGAPAKPREGIG